jgi:hypothetical protein
MHSELSITEPEESLRAELYSALYASDEATIKAIMSTSTAEAVRSLPTDGETPYLARAKRTIFPRDGHYSIMRNGARGLLDGQTLWNDVVSDLLDLLATNDDAGVFRCVMAFVPISFPDINLPSIASNSYMTVAPWTTLIHAARNRFRAGEVSLDFSRICKRIWLNVIVQLHRTAYYTLKTTPYSDSL